MHALGDCRRAAGLLGRAGLAAWEGESVCGAERVGCTGVLGQAGRPVSEPSLGHWAAHGRAGRLFWDFLFLLFIYLFRNSFSFPFFSSRKLFKIYE
jgi:hypothetical protein